MSSYSFSHQFYQHWTQAPESVRSVLVQELTDITDLLQTKTPFEEFVFSIHDIDTHLDDLYCAHELQQKAAKKIAAEQARQRKEAEQHRLEEARLEEKLEKLKRQRLATESAQAETAVKKQQEAAQQQKTSAEKVNKDKDSAEKEIIEKLSVAKNDTTDNASITTETDKDDANTSSKSGATAVDSASDATDNKTNNKQDHTITADNKKPLIAKPATSAAINLSPTDVKLSSEQQALIHELEVHIDDYLSEKMAQMSEDLKSWLRSEVSRQLIAQEAANATKKG